MIIINFRVICGTDNVAQFNETKMHNSTVNDYSTNWVNTINPRKRWDLYDEVIDYYQWLHDQRINKKYGEMIAPKRKKL